MGILHWCLMLFIMICTSCVKLQFRASDDAIKQAFIGTQYTPEVHYYDTLGRTMRYISIGADSLPTIVFVHGSPSSLSAWKHFMNDSLLLSKARLVLVDRPGYGYSGFGKSEKSIAKQAEMLRPVLQKHANQPVILVGASYGGPVAARMAMNDPGLIDGLVLLSASIAPKEEKIYSISYPAKMWLFKWMVPTSFRVANEEKLSHRKALEALLPDWKKITAPALVIHGDKDELIYPANAAFAKKMMTSTEVEVKMLPGMGHGLQFTQPDMIKELLYGYVDKVFDQNIFQATTVSPEIEVDLSEVEVAVN
jgi:pimeloyl-ACP methyl ester carboxylesterase